MPLHGAIIVMSQSKVVNFFIGLVGQGGVYICCFIHLNFFFANGINLKKLE
jgi:hypothetical protein